VHVNPDGTISAAWTGSMDYTGALTFTDRGMFFNHYEAAMWGPWPAARVESLRTGFGELARVDDHEVMMSHDGIVGIQMFANTEYGGTTFTEIAGSDDVTGFWPMAVSPDGTDDIYMVTANANPPTELRFSRSDDAGISWTVLNSVLPLLTAAEGFPGLNTGLYTAAETYQVAVYGTDVYVLVGMVNADLRLLHSADNGNPGSWTSTTIVDLPIDSWTGLTQTDVNGDFVTDTIDATDGYYCMFVDDAGDVHVFSGFVRLYNDGIGAYWSYNWENSMKMWYWRTGMAGASLIDLTVDWDNTDGLNDPMAGIGAMRTHYRAAGMTSMPAGAFDPATGTINLLYTMPIEYTDIYDDPLNLSAQSRRDIFGVLSTDGGTTWTAPENFTNNAEEGKENVFISVYPRKELARIHTVWQEDELPGTAITDLDVVDTNYIMYQAFIDADFGEVPMVCNAATGPGGLSVSGLTPTGATLNWDAVDLADQYVVAFWNAAAPDVVGKKRPNTNMYVIEEGKLAPETTYGFRVKTVCYAAGEISPYSETLYFTTPPLREGDLQFVSHIFPNPNNGTFTLSLGGMVPQEMEIVITNAYGQLVSQQLITKDPGQMNLEIQLQNVSTGMYFVNILTTGDRKCHTIVVE